jgi:hypothetical protein
MGINDIASFIEQPAYREWNKTKQISTGIRKRLFIQEKKPSLDVLTAFHEKAESLIHTNKLNNTYLTNREVKYLAWVILPCEVGRYTGLISITKAQKQIFSVLLDKDRFNSVAIEILAKEWNRRPPMYLLNFDSLTSIIEKMLTLKQSARLQHRARFLAKVKTSDGVFDNWTNSLITRNSEKSHERFIHFINQKDSYFSTSESEKALTKIKSNFWTCYFNRKLVKNCWVACDINSKVVVSTVLNVELELVNQDSEVAAFIMHIGDYIFIDLSHGDYFYVHNIKQKTLPDFNVKNINLDDLMAGHVNKYSFSSAGYWQYKTALFLKNTTGYMPSRSEYMIRS